MLSQLGKYNVRHTRFITPLIMPWGPLQGVTHQIYIGKKTYLIPTYSFLTPKMGGLSKE
jgi:hypothetical protein